MKIKDYSLYLIISEECGNGRGAVEIAKRAIEGGVDLIQMREKALPAEELIKLGKALSDLCRRSRVTFIVNDDPMLAKEVGADGVHLGQEDIKSFSLDMSRRLLGREKIIGISTHSVEQFEDANEKDFDYAAFGPIFATGAKNYFIGADGVEKILSIAKKPVFFIGGMNLSNIGDVLKKGAKNIALIRGISEAEDMTARTREFKNRIKDHCWDGARKLAIKINGKHETVDRPVNLMELVSAKGLVAEHIVIEHNFRIIPKDEWRDVALEENDNVEIVSFVGGG